MSWRRFAALVRHLPADAATVQAEFDIDPVWTVTNQLLAMIADYLALSIWQRAGKKNMPRPLPIPRPGVEGPTKLGKGKFTIDEMAEILAHWSDDEEEVMADGG